MGLSNHARPVGRSAGSGAGGLAVNRVLVQTLDSGGSGGPYPGSIQEFPARSHRQLSGRLVHVSELMSPLLTACKTLVFCGLAAGLWAAATAQDFSSTGGETAVSGPLLGDQVFPAASFGPEGGYL